MINSWGGKPSPIELEVKACITPVAAVTNRKASFGIKLTYSC
jgi:hypothetical protein